jgi:hypothetical protein
VSFAAITLCVSSQRVIPKVSVYFVIDLVRKLLDTPSYTERQAQWRNFYVTCLIYKICPTLTTFEQTDRFSCIAKGYPISEIMYILITRRDYYQYDGPTNF